eukprot:CAMPEP_0198230958 /NCGR_PEP_ID=MMETSP1445-20131203/114947_1 /TAXON_ID=36898 /ORGANISM="Pyramimonas sp., Strain CCMP2087" /LENGTH=409 /DNA_ID=CAMNT_0043911543 /DNA_START=528 /DNA_END=1757 /DNA_ORIENTATION=-
MAWTLEKVPCAIQGIALGNAGLASLFVLLGGIYDRSDEYVVAVYVFAPISLFFTALYLGKVVFHPTAFKADASAANTAFTFGAMSINLSLLASYLALPQLGLPNAYGLVGVSFAAIFQLVQEGWFLYICYITKSGPQPYWNAAVVSVAITPITGVPVDMPEWIRHTLWFVGLASMAVTLPVQSYSVFKHHRILGGTGNAADMPKLNNNPSVAIMQATASIVCSGWHASPVRALSDSMQDAVGDVLFAASITLFLLTMIAVVVRRKAIYGAIKTQNPALSAMTFPFVITATSAAFYYKRVRGDVMEVVVWILFGLCSTLVISVTLIYFKLILFGDMLRVPDVELVEGASEERSNKGALPDVLKTKPGLLLDEAGPYVKAREDMVDVVDIVDIVDIDESYRTSGMLLPSAI